MDLTAPSTYALLVGMLTRKEATQADLSRHAGVSAGHANNVLRWLVENQFVEKRRRTYEGSQGRPRLAYALVNPTGLLRIMAVFRPMSDRRLWTCSVDHPPEQILRDLRKRRVVFCLGTALEHFSSYSRADEISCYAIGDAGAGSAREIRASLAAHRQGIIKVGCYAVDTRAHGRRRPVPVSADQVLTKLRRTGIVQRDGGMYWTTRVQTVIDLFCDGRAAAARELLAHLWGVQL